MIYTGKFYTKWGFGYYFYKYQFVEEHPVVCAQNHWDKNRHLICQYALETV